jgi:hypothetical protein
MCTDGRNVLHLIFEGQLSRMRHMSEHSEDAVPVHLRSSLKNCLRLFGARGANVEQRDVIGNLPLAYALVFNHFTLVPAVLDMSTPKNLDLLAPVCYTHVMPVKPECQESDYDEYVHAKEEQREPAVGMSAEDKAKLGQVTRWLAAMREYRRRERSLSSFRQYAGESALHFFVKQGKLELVRAGLSRRHTSPCDLLTTVLTHLRRCGRSSVAWATLARSTRPPPFLVRTPPYGDDHSTRGG